MTLNRPVRIALFALACVAVAALSLAPGEELPSTGVSDKVEHFVAYAGLFLLGAWALASTGRLAVGLVALGLVLELLQASMGWGRQGDVLDALANTLGVGLGAAVALAIRRRR